MNFNAATDVITNNQVYDSSLRKSKMEHCNNFMIDVLVCCYYCVIINDTFLLHIVNLSSEVLATQSQMHEKRARLFC